MLGSKIHWSLIQRKKYAKKENRIKAIIYVKCALMWTLVKLKFL